jgi:diguanylate cyclase (GGDEF)-like protein/PAS domain S-box-containing protein
MPSSTPVPPAGPAARAADGAALRALLEDVGEGRWEWNVASGAVERSPRLDALLGFGPGEVEHSAGGWMRLIHADDRQGALAALEDLVAGRAPVLDVEYRMRTRAGGWRWLRHRARALSRSGDGRALLVSGIFADVSQRRDAEELLRESERALRESNARLEAELAEAERRRGQLEALTEMSALLQSCATEQETIEVLAGHAVRLLPGATGSLCLLREPGGTALEVATWGRSGPAVGPFPLDDCWALRRGRSHASLPREGASCAHAVRGTDNHLCVPMMAQGEALGVLYLRGGPLGAHEHRLARTAADAIALALANARLRERLRHQSIRDPLTGLVNRRYLEEVLDRELARAERSGRPCAVLMLDVDHFKKVNDQRGHDAGDAVLRAVAGALQAGIRAGDLAARWGGEEFTVVLPETDLPAAVQRAEALRLEVRIGSLAGGAPWPVTMSCGVAVFPRHAQGAAALVRAADEALLLAKSAGRDRVVAMG